MSRFGRNVVEHETATASKAKAAMGQLPDGVNSALNKIKEINEGPPPSEKKETPVPDGVRDLILFGKIIDNVKVGPYTFTLGTITNRQQKEIFKRLFAMSNEDKIVNLKTYTLAEAISSVNGAPLESLYYGEDQSIPNYLKRELVVSELQSSLVDVLFKKYEELTKRSSDLFESGGIEDAIKN